MYSSCSGTADPSLNSSEESDNFSESDDDAGGVPRTNLAYDRPRRGRQSLDSISARESLKDGPRLDWPRSLKWTRQSPSGTQSSGSYKQSVGGSFRCRPCAYLPCVENPT